MMTVMWIGGTPPALEGITWLTQTTRAGLVEQLVRAQPALIVTPLPDPEWRPFAHAVKTSAATRRIPFFVISQQPVPDAALHGVDVVASPAQWQQDGLALIRQHARVMSAETAALLDCQCREPLPPRAVEGIARFNEREYYRQHDLFEAQWMEERGPVRDLYRAILQVGIGYYHITRGNYRGALKMLQKSVQWLVLLPDECQGVDVRQLREDSFRVRAELERLGAERLDEFDLTLLRDVLVRHMPPAHA